MKKIIVAALFILGLIYLLLPSPSSIRDIVPLPNSTKSDLPGDTIQNPNIAAYFSNYRRSFITKFYRDELRSKDFLGRIFPPLVLNHPPEEAYTFVRDQQESTFLEEYTYPFKESLFVNGYEPVVKNGRSIDKEADNVSYNGNFYPSKATIRIYPIPVLERVVVYIAIWVCFILLYKLFKRVQKESS